MNPLPKNRLAHVDGLRAIAALYVLFHHCTLYVSEDLPAGNWKTATGFFIFGHLAVDLFIVLSGFCLMLPVIRNHERIPGGPLGFFANRARRILPPYFAVLALSLILIRFLIGGPTGSIWKNSLPVTPAGLWTHLLLIQDVLPVTSHQINYCLWSISVEWRIYFLFPVLVYCWSWFGPMRMAAGMTLASFLLLIPLELTFVDTSAGGVCLHYYGLFTFGMLAAGFARSTNPRLVRWRARLPWRTIFFALVAVEIILNKGYIQDIRLPWQCQDLLVGLAALAFLVAVTPSPVGDCWESARAALSWRPLAFVGTFSYSLYLIHAPLLQVIWAYFIAPLHLSPVRALLLLSTAGAAAILVAAYLFHLAFERPFMRSRKRREGGEPSVADSTAAAIP